MFNPRAFKVRQTSYWDAAADELDQGASALLAPVFERMLDAVKLQRGHRVLDLACGTGAGTLSAARRVGENGAAVGLDLSPRMVEQARERGARWPLANARFAVGDAERLEHAERSFDAVVCQLGLALFPNALAALKETLRVLVPGGHVALTAIGRPENSGFLLTPARVAAKHLPTVVVNEGGPTQLAYAPEGALEDILGRAGFKNVWTRRFIAVLSVADEHLYWDLFRRCVGGFAWRFAQERAEDQQRVIEEIKQAVRQRATREGLRLPLEVVMGVGTRPHSPESAGRAAPLEALLAQARRQVSALAPRAVEGLLRGGGVVVDVRQQVDASAAGIAGARWIPRGRLEEQIQAVVPDARTPVLCCCEDGRRSALAARSLSELGYLRPAYLEGGLEAWRQEVRDGRG